MNYDVSADRPAAQRCTLCIVLRRFSSRHGQSMLEMAMFLPVLLILIAGMIEIGAYAVGYLTPLDASREAARFGANLDPELTSKYPLDMRAGYLPFPDVRPPEIGGTDPNMTADRLLALCQDGETTNFYYEVACLTFQNVPTRTLDPTEGDDIVITVIGVTGGAIAHRWPLAVHANPADWPYHFQGAGDGPTNPTCTITNTENCRCWSLYGLRTSQFDNASIEERLESNAPATGFVIVEVFHTHYHLTGFFTIGDFIPNPIEMRPYTIFPVPAAEP